MNNLITEYLNESYYELLKAKLAYQKKLTELLLWSQNEQKKM